ncbi:hypothetical protein BCE75_107241 [Isoptericola sp. CG 20/1183]|uniref:Polyketide cyclase/dehydrase/lipid transport protein n=1 Tax=Isoptericola halotolerans TaxID=300560 RepID=A0ABX5EFU9_9MICO|nr:MULTISPECIES: hypothetical protein [Isoptericola]MCK0117152.1 hypothetical protein [Isoptericola sp. S6320L]PRZ05753.1 hypothetical protein BCL65_107241 [Isoptericola halotolerans]PRZ06321.1 hypothetical protein BCE75_107241 [Isoptericola sp. CG 20/1183]
MRPIEFELERLVRAPIDEVFARLVDIEGHNDWLAGTGSMLKRTRQTSAGPPRVGTTFVDVTRLGTTPGEIVELEAPTLVVFHWWERSAGGRTTIEGWPSYHLRSSGDDATTVRHRGRLVPHGIWRLGAPLLRRIAVKERTITVDALQASFVRESTPG